MRIAITGGTGLLGTALAHSLATSHEGFLLSDASTVEHEGCANVTADVRDGHGLKRALDPIKPDALIHTAALTRVDYCEDHAEEATELNVVGTANAAGYAAAEGARLVHISTDFVFDGTKPGGMYVEEDPVHVESVYARTKLEAEGEVRKAGSDHAILRTTSYGWNVRGKINYAMAFCDSFSSGKPVNAFTNQISTPMLANDLADAIGMLLLNWTPGLLHAGCATRASRAQFALELADVFGFDKSLVRPTELKDGMLPAKRPTDASLDSTKFWNAIGASAPTLREGIERFKRLREQGYAQNFRVVRG